MPGESECLVKILFVVDASPYTTRALSPGAKICLETGAAVDVVGVVPALSAFMEDYEISPARRDRHLLGIENLAKKAVEAAKTFLAEKGVNIASTCTIQAGGSIGDAVVEYALQEAVNLIILGTGTDKAVRAGLGGAVAQIARESPCSVMVIKSSDL